MLSPKHRLPLRFSRRQVESHAQTFRSPLFTLLVARLPDRSQQPPRFAVILSKKISNKATIRNRLRRQILAATGQLLPQIQTGHDVIILASKSLLETTYKQIKEEVKKIFVKSAVI